MYDIGMYLFTLDRLSLVEDREGGGTDVHMDHLVQSLAEEDGIQHGRQLYGREGEGERERERSRE